MNVCTILQYLVDSFFESLENKFNGNRLLGQSEERNCVELRVSVVGEEKV